MADSIQTVALELPRLFSPLLIALQDEEEFCRFPAAVWFRLRAGNAYRRRAEFGRVANGGARHRSSRPGCAGRWAAGGGRAGALRFGSTARHIAAIAVFDPAGNRAGGHHATELRAVAAVAAEGNSSICFWRTISMCASRWQCISSICSMSIAPNGSTRTERGVTYIRHVFDWSRIGLLFDDPEAWAREVL